MCAVLVPFSQSYVSENRPESVSTARAGKACAELDEASPFFQLVSRYFDEFERVYPEKYQKTYGFWRPVIRRSIDKFIKCGDLREGFARVKCTACNKEMFVP
jgi:hypothetical protein